MMANASTTDRQPLPEQMAPGLDLFVAAWIEEWTRYGGFVVASPDKDNGVGFPMDAQGPDYPEPRPDPCEQSRQDTRAFNDAHYQGRMRGMFALLHAVPYAREALQAHMQAHGMVAYAAGQPGAEQ